VTTTIFLSFTIPGRLLEVPEDGIEGR